MKEKTLPQLDPIGISVSLSLSLFPSLFLPVHDGQFFYHLCVFKCKVGTPNQTFFLNLLKTL